MERPPLWTRDFLLLMLGQLLQSTGFTSMLLLPLYLDWLEANRTEVGVAMAIAAVGGLAARPAVAVALDRYGRKPTLFVGTLVLTVAFGLIGGVDRVGPLLFFARVLVGVGTATLFTAYFTLASDLVPQERRAEGLALFGIAGLLPLVINPFADRLGLEGADFRWFFPAVGVVILLSLAALLPLREPPLKVSREPFVLRTVLDALRAPRLWPVWWATSVFSGLVAVFMAFVTVTAEARGLEDPSIAWLAYAGGAISVRVFGASLPERVGLNRILVPALGSYAIAMGVCAWASTPTGFLVAGGLAGFGHGFSFPVLMAQTVTRTPETLRGSAVSLFTALWDLSKLSIVPVMGWIADTWSDGTMLSACCAAGFAGLATWAWLEASLGRS